MKRMASKFGEDFKKIPEEIKKVEDLLLGKTEGTEVVNEENKEKEDNQQLSLV